jgi:hypothetical protein
MVDLSSILSSLFPDLEINIANSEETIEGNRVELRGDINVLELQGEEIDQLRFAELPEATPIDVQTEEEVTTLVVDPEEAESGDWEETKPEIIDIWEDGCDVIADFAYPFVSTVRDRYDDEYISDVLEYFEGIVPRRHFLMVRASLYLNKAIQSGNVTREDVRTQKRKIANKLGEEAFAISSLCSAGYFDENRFFRRLYQDLVEEGEKSTEEFKSIFSELATDKAFVVFVEEADTAQEIYDQTLMKIIRTKDYEANLDFVDIRGINRQNHETIEECMDILDENHDSLSYTREKYDHELVIRVDASSM